MSVNIRLDKSKIKLNDYYNRFEVQVNHNTGARIMDMANKAKHGLILEIKNYYPKKSNEANKLMWKLCTEISKILSNEYPISKEEVYRKAITEGNEYQSVDVPNDKLTERARMWASRGTGWFSIEMNPLPEGGKTTVHQYFGSSSYNSKQMYYLIDRLKVDAEEQGIDVSDEALKALLNSN